MLNSKSIMENLKNRSRKKVVEVPTDFKRYLYHLIDWANPLIIIPGYRGAGEDNPAAATDERVRREQHLPEPG
jgi:hypothetical protein